MQNVWGLKTLEAGHAYRWGCGPLQMWFRYSEGVWETATAVDLHTLLDPVWEPVEAFPETSVRVVNYARFCENPLLYLTPVFPDRPLVIRPADRIVVLPKQKTTYFVAVSFFLCVRLQEAAGTQLVAEPTRVLSNTWFGDTFSGELCYSIRQHARRDVHSMPLEPQHLILPVMIQNDGNAPMIFEKICLRTDPLAIARREPDGRLWSSPIQLLQKSPDAPAEVRYPEDDPFRQEGDEILKPYKAPDKEAGLFRSFNRLSNNLWH